MRLLEVVALATVISNVVAIISARRNQNNVLKAVDEVKDEVDELKYDNVCHVMSRIEPTGRALDTFITMKSGKAGFGYIDEIGQKHLYLGKSKKKGYSLFGIWGGISSKNNAYPTNIIDSYFLAHDCDCALANNLETTEAVAMATAQAHSIMMSRISKAIEVDEGIIDSNNKTLEPIERAYGVVLQTMWNLSGGLSLEALFNFAFQMETAIQNSDVILTAELLELANVNAAGLLDGSYTVTQLLEEYGMITTSSQN
jgi:tetrahydromethanopterin S-methyltransferase subunit B